MPVSTPIRLAALCALVLTLAGCATAQRLDAANDVHALLVSIRDDDRAAFERHIDRPALKRQIEARLMSETHKADDGWRGLAAALAPALADLAGDVLIQPRVFRAVAEQYGYTPARPLPGVMAIGGALKSVGEGQVCATKRKDGPCLLTFTQEDGVWRLTSFDGELSMLRARP